MERDRAAFGRRVTDHQIGRSVAVEVARREGARFGTLEAVEAGDAEDLQGRGCDGNGARGLRRAR